MFQKGHKVSEKHKKKLSIIQKGNKYAEGMPPNKTSFKKGMISWNKGKKSSEETIEKLRKSHLGQKAWNKGKKLSETHVKHLKEADRSEQSGEKHWNWQGGLSLEPYGLGFSEKLKEEIRERDNRKCQICDIPELECEIKLDVHHIDYNKRNHKKENLIALCHSCHTKTGQDREFWEIQLSKTIKIPRN